MSAFIVSKEHIDVLVALVFGGPRRERGSRSIAWSAHMSRTHGTPDEVGRMLLAENVASVSHRYPKDRADELPGPRPVYWLVSEAGEGGYTFSRQPYRLTAVEGLKALGCYEYQSCEHPGWTSSQAHTLCRSLHGALVYALPGIDEAPWEWDSDSLAAAHAARGASRPTGRT